MHKVNAGHKKGITMSVVRVCAQCRGTLSRYTSGDICNPCLTAARAHPERQGRVALPLEFWFGPAVRGALARWEWDVVLQQVYRETGASQARLARTAGVSQAQISRLMHAKSRTPTIATVLGMVDGFGIPRLLAGLAPKGLSNLATSAVTVEENGNRAGGQEGGDVRRREFGKAIMISLVPAAIGVAGTGQADVTKLRPDEVTADLYALFNSYGGGAVADLAERRLRSITVQLKDTSLPTSAETRVHQTMGELNICAATLAFDAGQQDRAERLCKDALYLTHLAGDTPLRLHVLYQMSYQATVMDRPGESAHLAEAALSDAGSADPRLRALLTMRLARAAAQRHDQTLLRQNSGAAWRLLERPNLDGKQPSWLTFFGEQTLTVLEGLCATAIGRHAEAATAYRRAVSHAASLTPLNQAKCTARLAAALASCGRVDEAVAAVHEGLPRLTQMTSAELVADLTDADHELSPYMDVSGVPECRDIMAGLLSR